MNASEEIILNLNEERLEVGRTLTWRAKNADFPVTIAGDLGVAPDGRR